MEDFIPYSLDKIGDNILQLAYQFKIFNILIFIIIITMILPKAINIIKYFFRKK